MILGERIFKALIIIGAAIAALGVLGFNLTTALAGLGIGGPAIAFAAQKHSKIFGGVSVLGDEVIRVGDTCQFGERVGTAEDRSACGPHAFWTTERTELSIPNGALATMNA